MTTASANLAVEQPAKQEKLTNWTNEPTLAELKADYTGAQDDHQQHVNEVDNWIKNRDGQRKFKTKKGKSKVVPKVIRKQAEWRYSSLSEPFLSAPDMFKADPITWEDKKAAVQNGLVLNNQFNTKINKVKFIDDYVRTAVDEGTVIVKVGWEYESEEVEIAEMQYEDQPILDNKLALQAIQEGREPLQAVPVGFEKVVKTRMIKNQPTLEICDYKDVIVDPTCEGDVDKAGFIIYRFETNLSNLKKDGRYTNLNKIRFDHGKMETDEETPAFEYQDKARKKLWVYEYWGFRDIDGTGVVTPFVASWVGETLIRMELNPFPDKGLPFVIRHYLPRRKKVYGESDGYLLEDNQDIVGAVSRGMIDIMGRSANAQQGVRKDALDVVNSRRFESGEDYKFNNNVDPRQAFHMGTFPEIPQSAMLMIQHQNNEAESLTGVKAYSNGISGQALGNIATGVRGALDAASERELGILRRLADGLVEIGHKIIAMNGEFLEDQEVVRITNDEFVAVRRDDLAGNIDLRLSISTADSDNQKAQELAFMLQTTGPNGDPAEIRIIRAEIARLRKMPDLAKRIEEYQPQPDPLAQKKAMLEIKLLEAQIANEQAKGLENQADIGLKTAKTETEKAKTRDLHSEADQKDQEFLEKDQGIDHAKEMEKLDHGRGTQLDLKAADKMLNPDKENESGSEAGFMEDFNL